MGLYRRDDSPVWWMVISVRGQRPRRMSTQIPCDAPTAEERAELRGKAQSVFAETQANAVLRAKSIGPKPTIAVGPYFAWYLKHVSAHKRGRGREAEILRALERDLGKTTTLQEITRERVLEWRTSRLKHVAATTVDRELDVLKHALSEAVPTYLEASPLAGLKRLRGRPAREPGVLSREQEARLLAALTVADRVIVIVAIDTLMRAGSLLELRWRDVGKDWIHVHDPKAGPSYDAPLSARAADALTHLTRRGPYVFWHRRKAKTERVRSNSLKQMFEDGCARAGIAYGRTKGVTFHGLRHTGATRLMEAGVDIRTIQRWGGWRSLRMLTRYIHPSDARMTAAANLIGEGVAFTWDSRKPRRREKRPGKSSAA